MSPTSSPPSPRSPWPSGSSASSGSSRGTARCSSPTPAPRRTRRRSSSPAAPAAPTSSRWRAASTGAPPTPPRATGRTPLVAMEGSFHGRTMGALALPSKAAYREPFEPLPGEVTFVPYGDTSALEAALTDETAAVLLEPMQGEAGVLVPPAGYLADARRITRDHGSLLW